MKARLTILIACLLLSACSLIHKVPREFIGVWQFDIERTRQGIHEMEMDQAKKEVVERILLNDYDGIIKKVDGTGTTKHPGVPGNIVVRITVSEERDDGYILASYKYTGKNPPPKYSFDRIEDGYWRVSFLNDKRQPLPDSPDHFWRKISN